MLAEYHFQFRKRLKQFLAIGIEFLLTTAFNAIEPLLQGIHRFL